MWHAKNLPLSSRQAHKLVTSLSLPSWISSWATLEKGDSANQPTSKLQNTERKILHLGTNWLENKTAQPHLERDKYGLENRKWKSDLSPSCELRILNILISALYFLCKQAFHCKTLFDNDREGHFDDKLNDLLSRLTTEKSYLRPSVNPNYCN